MKTLLIYNPTSGQVWTQFNINEVKEYLTSKGYQLDIVNDYENEELSIKKALKENYDLIIVAGGDGTINKVIQYIAFQNIKLGIVPIGTANVLARELKIPFNVKEALDIIISGDVTEFDLGKVNNHYFLLMTGIGFDAKITKEVDPVIKKFTGIIAFILAGVKTFFKHKGVRMKLMIYDQNNKRKVLRRKIYQLIVSNTATYASGFIISEQAKYNDGLLELVFLKDKGLIDVIKGLLLFFLGMPKEWADIEIYKIKKVKIKTKKPVPLQIDGEPIGYTPADIEVIPKALKVIAPKNLVKDINNSHKEIVNTV